MKSLGLLLVVAVLTSSCDSKQENSSGETKPDETSSPVKAGTFSLKGIKISGSQATFKTEGATKPDALKKCIEEGAYASEFMAADGEELFGSLTYDISVSRKDSTLHSIALFGKFSPKLTGEPRFDVGVNVVLVKPNSENKTISQAVDDACKDIAGQFVGIAQVSQATDDQLIAILKDTTTKSVSLEMALEAIRERSLKTAAPDLLPLLNRPDDKLAVRAASVLSSLSYQPGQGALIKLAERLSRDRSPQFAAYLPILGVSGGTETIAYLETVAQAHENKEAQRFAKETIENIKKRSTGK